MPSPYLAHADAQGRLCGLPPCCVLSWGMICSATLMCGVIALSRHVGLLSQDPLLPSCDPLLLAKAPGLQLKMKVFPGAIKAMGASLSTNSSLTQQQQRASAELVIEQTVGMLRSSHDAKRLMRCAGGAKSLGGFEAVQVDQLHRALWRLYGRASPQLDSNHRFFFRGVGHASPICCLALPLPQVRASWHPWRSAEACALQPVARCDASAR